MVCRRGHAILSQFDLYLLTFNFIFLARLAAAMDYTRAKFGVDSSNRFSFRARTHSVTDATDHHASCRPVAYNILQCKLQSNSHVIYIQLLLM